MDLTTAQWYFLVAVSMVLPLIAWAILRLQKQAWERRQQLEYHVKWVLRMRYVHPEDLAEALTELEIQFPHLAPVGFMTVSDAKGKLAMRADALAPENFNERCRKGPEGWRCSRPAGHPGPCALHAPRGHVFYEPDLTRDEDQLVAAEGSDLNGKPIELRTFQGVPYPTLTREHKILALVSLYRFEPHDSQLAVYLEWLAAHHPEAHDEFQTRVNSLVPIPYIAGHYQ